ncbi:MAG: hypothetical protein Q9207_007456 [Kuettlingeria erythrocarpa]
MWIRGLRIVRFRGRYWRFCNYGHDHGASFVESIPVDPEEYKKWLHGLREYYAKWDTQLQKILSITPALLANTKFGKTLVGVLEEAFDRRLEGFPTANPRCPDKYYDTLYTFDLDQEVFSIDNTAHFRLQHIPRIDSSIDAVYEDGQGRRFVHPRLAPEESLGSLVNNIPIVSPRSLDYWKSLTAKQVTAKADRGSISAQLRLKLFDIFEDSQIPNLRITLLSWTADDLVFRELAFFILCLAAGEEYLRIVDDRRIELPLWTHLYGAIVHGEPSECERELVSSLGDGFHVDGLPMGSAPPTPQYWFEGALVCLVPQLRRAGVMEKAMADAVRYGRDVCGRTSFNAILISVGDLVLLRSFPDGRVEHTPIMCLLSTGGSSGLDAQKRYGKAWLDKYYEVFIARSEDAGGPVAETEASAENAQGSVAGNGESSERDDVAMKDGEAAEEEGECNDEVGPRGWEAGDTFLSLISFLNATVYDTLKPVGGGRQKLPTEVIQMILGYITDLETHHACMRVSRAFRSFCHKRPLLVDGVKLLKVLPNSTTTVHRELGLLAENSMGLPLAITVKKAKNFTSPSLSQFIVGKEWNRKSFCPDALIAIEGLVTPTPFDLNPTYLPNLNFYEYDKIPRPIGAEWRARDPAITEAAVDAQADFKTLCQCWERTARLKLQEVLRTIPDYEPSRSVIEDLEDDKDWLIPANTRQYFIETGDIRGKTHKRFLLLRIKRASRYWSCLWHDIIREVEELLAKVDDHDDLDRKKRTQLVGAANPEVLLAVGWNVRCFKWDAASLTLTERIPNHMYSMMDKWDEMVIGALLVRAIRKLEAAEQEYQKGFHDAESNDDLDGN